MNSVTLSEMLNAREHRALLQNELISDFNKPLICFTMNIPGPVKLLPGIAALHENGINTIEDILKHHNIPVIQVKKIREKTGYETIYSVDGDAGKIKELMVSIEDKNELTRLFDIDVLNIDGSKISREDFGFPPRRCLLCSEQAQICSRSRAHSVEELISRIHQLLEEGCSI